MWFTSVEGWCLTWRWDVKTVECSAGTIEYVDVGAGPVVLFLHGLLMDASLWDAVIADLSSDNRCIAPTLPLGGHRVAIGPSADLSLRGLAAMVTEFAERLDLSEVTLVGNDTGGAIVQMLLGSGGPWITRAVLVSCDAFDNFPPGLTGKVLFGAGRLPPRLFSLFVQQMRLRTVRRLPIAFGWLTRTGDAVTARWIEPLLGRPDIRRDTIRALRALSAERTVLVDAVDQLARFQGPVLVAWAVGDRVMPPVHGRRLADLLPDGRLVEIDDSYTLIPLDQPHELAQAVSEFVS
jgi:pimeloyl-ACP methyl ester carboxylesterase